jgi:DNA-binding MarR family transcriptional regulator
MDHTLDNVEWLFRTLDRVHHNCMKMEFTKRKINEASHPELLFVLKDEIPNNIATQKELADFIGVSYPTVAVSIKRMTKAGLLKKVHDKTDLRKNLVSITKKGYIVTSECEDAFAKIDQEMFKDISDDEKNQLRKIYIKMLNNLGSIGAQLPTQLKELKI